MSPPIQRHAAGCTGSPSARSAQSRTRRGLRAFFRLVFALAWGPPALYLLFPDRVRPLVGPVSFANPFVYCLAFAPVVAALIASAREGRAAVLDLCARLLRWRIDPLLYAAAVIGVAAVTLVPRYLAAAWHEAAPPSLVALATAPSTAWSWFAPKNGWHLALVATVVTDPGPLGEELGWRGYALPRLAQRFSGSLSALLLGIIWALWHAPAFLFAGLPQSRIAFVPFLVCTVALSVLMAWVTHRARGSVLPAMLMHWTYNRCADVFGVAAPWTAAFLGLAALALVVTRGIDLECDRHGSGA
jgi:membrane protease YdiL (CAAX protease family)